MNTKRWYHWQPWMGQHPRANMPWTPDEDDALKDKFWRTETMMLTLGARIKLLAERHGRTEGAIMSRLTQKGLVNEIHGTAPVAPDSEFKRSADRLEYLRHIKVIDEYKQKVESMEQTISDQRIAIDNLLTKISEYEQRIEGLEIMKKVCMDLHAALGVEWGHDPYRVIKELRAKGDNPVHHVVIDMNQASEFRRRIEALEEDQKRLLTDLRTLNAFCRGPNG